MALKKRSNIAYIDMPVELARQYQNYTCATMGKFHNVFSSTPNYISTMPIDAAVCEYVNDYLAKGARW
jgi:hypothetical protein